MTVAPLQQSLSKAEIKMTGQAIVVQTLQNELSDLRRCTKDLHEENDQLLNDMHDIIQENEELKQELYCVGVQCMKYKDNCKELRDEKEKLEESIEISQEGSLDPEEVKDLVAQIRQQMMHKFKLLSQGHYELEKQNRELEKQNRKLEAEKSDLQEEMQKLMEEKMNREKKMFQMTIIIEDLLVHTENLRQQLQNTARKCNSNAEQIAFSGVLLDTDDSSKDNDVAGGRNIYSYGASDGNSVLVTSLVSEKNLGTRGTWSCDSSTKQTERSSPKQPCQEARENKMTYEMREKRRKWIAETSLDIQSSSSFADRSRSSKIWRSRHCRDHHTQVHGADATIHGTINNSVEQLAKVKSQAGEFKRKILRRFSVLPLRSMTSIHGSWRNVNNANDVEESIRRNSQIGSTVVEEIYNSAGLCANPLSSSACHKELSQCFDSSGGLYVDFSEVDSRTRIEK